VLLEGTISNNSTTLTKLIYDTENYDRAVQKLKDEITELAKAKEKYEKLIALTDDSKKASNEHLSVVKKLDSLSKREYRGYILTNIINHLNAKAKEYSKLVFGTEEFEIYLDGNALDISYGGKLVESLSGGERTRIDLILQFAIRDLLNSHLNLTSNILVLDEITDFLDATSCAAVMQLIENELNTVESVFIISHHAETLNLSFDSEIKVVKNSDGISEVYQ
jgi:DNA repair exonuclease SbcCD ATPase subunit